MTTFSVVGDVRCAMCRCPAGSSCDPITGETAACPAGTWSALGDGDCGVCEALVDDAGRFTCAAFADAEGDGTYASTCTGVSPFAGTAESTCDASTGTVTINELDLDCAAGFYDADEFTESSGGDLARRLADTARECIE